MRRLPRLILAALLVVSAAPAFACDAPATLCPGRGALALIDHGRPAALLTDPGDDPGVLRAAANVRADLGRVGGGAPRAPAIIAGTIGRNAVIDRLIRERRLDVTEVAGQWEAYAWQVVDHPAPETFIVPSGFGAKAQWFRNIQTNPRVRVYVGSHAPAPATARQLDQTEADRVLAQYRATRPQMWERFKPVLEETLGRPITDVNTQLPLVELRLDPR